MDHAPPSAPIEGIPARASAGRPLTVIINTRSRRGKEVFADAVAGLRAAGLGEIEAHAVDNTRVTRELLQREITAGAAMVVVGGGDGTLSECAGQLAGTSLAMGVLPLGTGNTLARSLGIPLALDAAAQAIAEGHIEAMDVGRVNGHVFVNSVTLGLSTEIAAALSGKTKHHLGLLSWPVIGSRVVLRHRPLTLRVNSAERNFRVRTHQFVVANGRYIAGPIAAAPDASLQSHCLEVFTLGGPGKASLWRAVMRWLLGRHIASREEHFFKTAKLAVTSNKPVAADVDGEIVGCTPLEIEIVPAALLLVVPSGYDAGTA